MVEVILPWKAYAMPRFLRVAASTPAKVGVGDGLLRGEGVPPLRVAGILPAIRGPGSPNAIHSRLGTYDALVTKEQGQDGLATKEKRAERVGPALFGLTGWLTGPEAYNRS